MDYIKTVFEGAATVPSVYQCLVAPNSELSQSISRLYTRLIIASQLIERSECWCFRYDYIGELLSYLKNAVYQAELTIEEFKSQRRRAENHDWNIAGELINNFKNWATGFEKKVISAQGNLDLFCDQLEKICNGHEIPQNPKKFSRPITVSRPPVVLCGRNKEMDHAIGMLGIPRSGLYTGDSSGCRESKRKIHVLPIVGIGGVGKTTLSQMVYKDKRVDSYYDLKIWLCVTEKFDLERMLKEMIQYATKKGSDFTSLDLLEDTLIEAIKSKRVLLVLDDIWSAEWQQLLGPMNEASEGSAIILTTRSREHFNNSSEGNMTLLKPILLEGLEEGIYWDFFKKCAGLNVGLSNYSELEHIAEVICSRLKGLPLAAKTVGGVLKQRIDRQHWITIRDSEMWKVRQGEDVESFCGFMSLEKLLLKECERLTCPTKMSLPPCIKYLELDTCGELESSIPGCLENLTSLEVLIILNCPNIVSTCPTEISLPPSLKHLELNTCGELEKSIPSCLENLTSLEVLILAKCSNLVFIPNEVMRSLLSLRRLNITFCPNLESLGDEEFLKSMDHLFIQGCPKHPLTRERNPNGRQLSAGALATAAPSSSDTIPQVTLIEQTSTTGSPLTPGSSTIPSNLEMSSTATMDVPSSSNPRKRKAGDQN
ncbi:hypothetical protein LUZ61_008906 [Rhynchospora tenuis]|uniref:NB-ARC domain-containing protein n=1 Tax=Rhynchospora tenuis TaxID=198213 RepID=A0AAD5ZW79_9POAL|nr:hypothetical protein LUZ61_008906 [Rhynchospora tenuis]